MELEIVVDERHRGAIFNGGVLLFKGFPDSLEYTDETFPADQDLTGFRAFECLEGTLIRVFNHSGKWYTTTSRKLDAFASKWASPKTTFGQSFAAALRSLVGGASSADESDETFLVEFYDEHLVKDKLYTFLLSPSAEERLVCEVDSNERVVYVCCEDPTHHSMDFDDEISLGVDRRFPKRKELHLTTAKDVIDYVFDRTDYRTSQGVILFAQPSPGEITSIKVLSKEYADRYALRGNVSSLRFRYLELRSQPARLEAFLELYPEMRAVGEEIEEEIYHACVHLHSLYMRAHIEKDPSVVCSREEQAALREIHNRYVVTRHKTTASRINDVLTAGNPSRLNRLLRERVVSRKRQQQQQ